MSDSRGSGRWVPACVVAVASLALAACTSSGPGSAGPASSGAGSGSTPGGQAPSPGSSVPSSAPPTSSPPSAASTPSSTGTPSAPDTLPSTPLPPATDVCALLTPAQVKAALGGPVGQRRDEPIGEFRSCGWYGATPGVPDPALVQVQVSGRHYTLAQFETTAKQLAVGPTTAVPGVGDAAYRSGDQTSGTYLVALRGRTFFQIVVTGTGHDADRAVAVARIVAARLPS
ncbi:MAG: hypothetical protein ACTHMS_03525 [Jatrophihabitans sp.]|uniref:hypothetical protein n=1 Tax=Jatrophihabitans sp. TaxID=1932789 RepID=UPI003F7F1539